MNVEGVPPLFTGPDALEPGPLWDRGRRRPGPNRWGFDWHAPRLEPVDLRNKGAHQINRKVHAFFTSTDNLARRHELIPSLARRKKTGTRQAPVRRVQGAYPQEALEDRTHKGLRIDAATGLFRLCALVGYLVDWRTNRIVFWRQGGEGGEGAWSYPTRAQLCDCAGFPVRVDESQGPDRRRVRAYQVDDRIEDGTAAGLFRRHEQVRKKSVEFRVTSLFWIVSGVHKLRDAALHKLKKDAGKAAAARREAEQQARRSGFSAPEVAIAIAELARTATNDTDFYAADRRSPRERGWDPPDK
jgi:hypothetical protein